MSKIPASLKGISHQIQSQMSQREYKGHKIPKKVLDKYLKIGNQTCLSAMEAILNKIKPVWSITSHQIINNIKGIVYSQWPFSQQNRSIYLAIWGPISLIFFTYLIHNSPYQNKFMIFEAGLIDMGLIFMLGYLGYVFANVLKFPFNDYFQHVCIASHINLITWIYCCICTGAIKPVIIIASIIYIALCSYLHFNLYNKSIKPTLCQFVILLILLIGLYTSAAYLFSHSFTSQQQTNNLIIANQTNIQVKHHFETRKYSQKYF